MATADSVIKISIIGDARKLTGAVDKANKKVSGFSTGMKQAAKSIGTALVGLFAISKAFEFVNDSLNEADRWGDGLDNLNRIIGKVNTKKLEQAAGSFHDLGLSTQDVLELSVVFARIAKTIGLKPKLIADYADDVAAVGQAMALVDENGRDAATWVALIAKAASKPAKSTSKPLAALGIKVSEVRVIRDALKETHKASEDLLTPAELSAARLKIIMEKLKPVLAEAMANPDLEMKQAALQARIEELQGKLGQGLAPIIADLLQNLLDISESEWVDSMLKGVEVVKAAIPGLVTDFQEGWGRVQEAIQPAIDQLVGIPEDLQQIADGAGELATAFGTAVNKMIADLATLLSPLARIADIINDIFGSDHTATFTVVESGTRAPRNSPGGGGDRATSDAVRRQAERNGGPRVGEIP